MNKIGFKMGILCTALLAGCGGSNRSPQEPGSQSQVTVNESLPPEEQPTLVLASAEQRESPPPPVDQAPVQAEPLPPPPLVAIADVKTVKDDAVIGAMTFERGDDGMITIAGQFTGLRAGKYALYVHEQGDCSGKGKRVGAHLNPTKVKHGPPASSVRHAGDFGNLEVDASGNASFMMKTDSVTMEADRPDSVLSRAVVIHAKPDDKKGSGGAVLACGVITLKP